MHQHRKAIFSILEASSPEPKSKTTNYQMRKCTTLQRSRFLKSKKLHGKRKKAFFCEDRFRNALEAHIEHMQSRRMVGSAKKTFIPCYFLHIDLCTFVGAR